MTMLWDFLEAGALCVWRTSFTAAILGAVVLALKAVARSRLTPRWHYVFGGLVLIRLLCPWSFESHWGVGAWLADQGRGGIIGLAQFHESAASADNHGTSQFAIPSPGSATLLSSQVMTPHVADSLDGNSLVSSDQRAISAPAAIPENAQAREPVSSDAVATSLIAFRFLAAAWLVVCLGLLIHAAIRHARFARHVRRWARPLPSLASLLEECRRQLGVKRPVALVEIEGLHSPAVFGFWRPRVLLPAGLADSLTREELRHIFLHELAHIRSGDVLLNWLVIAARSLHWFNPLAWIVLRQVLADRELLRDAMAVRALAGNEGAGAVQRAYGHTLVKLATSFSQPRLSPGLAALIHTEKEIHRRITLMKTPLLTKPRYVLNVLSGAALAILAALSFTAATGEEEKLKDPPAPKPEVPAPPPPPAVDQPVQPRRAERPGRADRQNSDLERGYRERRDRESAEAREHAERDHKQRIRDMEKRLEQIDREIAELRKRAEGEKDGQLDQNLAALKDVRAELLKEFYRAKYGPPPVRVEPPAVPPPADPAAAPRSFSPVESARMQIESDIRINEIKMLLEALKDKEGDGLIRTATDLQLLDPRTRNIYDAHAKNEAAHQQMLRSGYGPRHPDVQALEALLNAERDVLNRSGRSIRRNLEDQLSMGKATLENIRRIDKHGQPRIEVDSGHAIGDLRRQMDDIRRAMDEMRASMKPAASAAPAAGAAPPHPPAAPDPPSPLFHKPKPVPQSSSLPAGSGDLQLASEGPLQYLQKEINDVQSELDKDGLDEKNRQVLEERVAQLTEEREKARLLWPSLAPTTEPHAKHYLELDPKRANGAKPRDKSGDDPKSELFIEDNAKSETAPSADPVPAKESKPSRN